MSCLTVFVALSASAVSPIYSGFERSKKKKDAAMQRAVITQ
jgi:hypothetical protein